MFMYRLKQLSQDIKEQENVFVQMEESLQMEKTNFQQKVKQEIEKITKDHEQEIQELREEFSRKSEEWHAKIKFYQKMFEDSQKNVELEKSRADKLETQLKQIQKFVNDVVSV